MLTKSRIALVLFVIVSVVLPLGAAQNVPGRRATVTDRTGTATKLVSDLVIKDCGPNHDDLTIKQAEGLVLLIPVAALVSMGSEDGSHFTVKYLWQGKEKTILAELYCGATFEGDTSFGNLKLKSKDLRTLTFDAVASNASPRTQSQVIAEVTLKDGRIVRLSQVQRWASWNSGMFEHKGLFDTLALLRGASTISVDLGKIASLAFKWDPADVVVTVTLKDGSMVTGRLPSNSQDGFSGFTGVTDDGECFVELPRSVRFISR